MDCDFLKNLSIYIFELCYHFHIVFLFSDIHYCLQYKLPGMLMLLMRLAQGMYLNNDEQVAILDLLSRMISFNTVFCLTCCSCFGF